jgi:hypothetical protein
MARSKQSKSKQMKIKQPSLKGMKNTSYLGHFAQDQFIKQGHNFSGRFDINRLSASPSGASNPFEATSELNRRKNELASEMNPLQRQLDALELQRRSDLETGRQQIADIQNFEYVNRVARPGSIAEVEKRMVEGDRNLASQQQPIRQQMESYRGRRKKFIEEI